MAEWSQTENFSAIKKCSLSFNGLWWLSCQCGVHIPLDAFQKSGITVLFYSGNNYYKREVYRKFWCLKDFRRQLNIVEGLIKTTHPKSDDHLKTFCIFPFFNKQKGHHLQKKSNQILHLDQVLYRMLQDKLNNISICDHKLDTVTVRKFSSQFQMKVEERGIPPKC